MSSEDEVVMDDTIKFKIGRMSSDVEHVKEAVDKVVDKLDNVNKHVIELNGSTIKAAQCAATHNGLQESLREMTDEIRKKKTRDDNPAITGKNLLTRIKENILTIASIITAIGVIILGWFYLAHMTVRVDNALRITDKQEKTLKRVEDKVSKPKYIYVQVPLPSPPPMAEKKKPRKHR